MRRQSLIHPHFSIQLVRPPLVTYTSLCIICVTYGTLCYATGHKPLLTQACYREWYRFQTAFFTLRRFLPCNASCFCQCFPRASSLASKFPGLRADLWNIIPAWLFIWITAIHKRCICGGLYLRAGAGQSRRISFTKR